MPWHLEVRAAYWPLPLTQKSFRAYALVGGGIAQIDAKTRINEYDCEDAGLNPDGTPNPNEPAGSSDPSTGQFIPDPNGLSPFEQCQSGKKTFYNIKNHKPVRVDAWKKLGQAFVETGVGGVLALAPNLGLTLEAKVLYTLPSAGLVFQPSLGVVVGL